MIKLEALRAFIAVAEAGNIKDAAAQLCRTPSAVSMALKNFEDELGSPLFETDRKNSLTALGGFILETGRLQVQSFDRTVGHIRAFADNKIGRLSIASVPSVAIHLLPSILPEFIRIRSTVDIELHDMDSGNVGAFVESGQADLGIAGRPSSPALIHFEALFRDPFKVVCGSDSALVALGRPVSWQDLSSEVLIRNGASESIDLPGYRALSERATITVRNVTSLLALARSGLGVTLLPALATRDLPDGVVALELAGTESIREVGLLSRKGTALNPVALAFRRLLLESMPEPERVEPMLER